MKTKKSLILATVLFVWSVINVHAGGDLPADSANPNKEDLPDTLHAGESPSDLQSRLSGTYSDSATHTKAGDVIPLETLHKLRPGMTYSEVCAILGKSGECERKKNETPEGTITSTYCTFWWNFGTSSAKMVICEFQNNQLTGLTNNFGKDGKSE